MNNRLLILIIGLVLVLVTLCILYLVVNRGNEKVVELSFKSLLVPVAIAFGLFLFEFLKPVKIENNKMVFSITEDPFILTKLVSDINGVTNLINLGTKETTFFYTKNKDALPFTTEKNKIEIAEIILLHLINKRYADHWQIDYKQGEPFFDVLYFTTGKKSNAENIVVNLDEETLKNIYPQDHLIQNIDSGIKFVLPKKTKFNVSGNEYERAIRIENNYINANLSIERIGVSTVPPSGGKTATLIKKKLELLVEESYSLVFHGYVLKMEIEPKRLHKWNPKTIEQTEWLIELFEYLEMSYGWETIINQLEENNYS